MTVPGNSLCKVKTSIAKKIALRSSFVLTLSLVIVSTTIFMIFGDILKKRIIFDLSFLAKLKTQQINSLLKAEIENCSLFSSRIIVKNVLAQMADNKVVEERSLEELSLTVDEARKAVKQIVRIDIFDSNGRFVFSTDKRLAEKDFPARLIFGKGNKEYDFGDMSFYDGNLVYDISMPVFELKGDRVVGFSRIVFSAETLLAFFDDYSGLGNSGEWVLGKKEGLNIVFLNPLRHKPDAALKFKVPLAEKLAEPMEQALIKESGSMISIDYSGKEVLSAYQHITIPGWGLVAKIDIREAFAPVNKLLGWVVLLSLGTILAGLFVILFFARRFSDSIKKLCTAAELISSGDVDHRVDIDSDDELGLLARAFNDMVSKKVVSELEEANKKLSKLDRMKSEFVADVSHEFKNPLAIIKESMALIGDGSIGEINQQQRQVLESGKKTVDRLIRLVSNLLDLSKMEFGKVEIKRERIDMLALVEDLLYGYRMQITKKDIRLMKHFHVGSGVAWADRDRISQVILNLLDNAIKYSPHGGEIGIRMAESTNEILFEISDHGKGIPKENFDKLFSKFERIDTEKQEGTGLGLSIAKEIIEQHKGRIWVESGVGIGSRFIFTIPKDFRSK